MFQGIVEEMGVVKRMERGLSSASLTIMAKTVLEDLRTGESIAVNGACLTVTGVKDSEFSADLSPETMTITTLGSLKEGDGVNLERAMRLSDRIGGHLLTGHVDGVGVIKERRQEGEVLFLTIDVPKEIMRCCVKKGSLAVDGISLTINDLTERAVSVCIIPHTTKVTTLGVKGIGAAVNLEGDLIGKYIERMLTRENFPLR